MGNTSVLSFSAGELTPLLDPRSDFNKYSSGCRTLSNMIPRVYGPAVRRPGTEYIYEVRDSTKRVLLVPFEYSATVAYVCEFSDGTIRFFYDGGILLDTASVAFAGTVSSTSTTVTFTSAADAILAGYHATYPKLGAQLTAGGQAIRHIRSWTNATTCVVDVDPSPAWSATAITKAQCPVQVSGTYNEDDLFDLQFKQLNDVMFITHRDYGIATLSRTSATVFTFTHLQAGPLTYDTNEFVGGPFRERNDIAEGDGVTITPNKTTGDGCALTASSGIFETGHVGALFALTQPRATVTQSGSLVSPTTGLIGVAMTIKGGFTFHTSGTWEGTVKLQRSTDGTYWEDYRVYTNRNVDDYEGDEEEAGVQYRINVTALTSGTVQADLTIHESTQTGIIKIVSTIGGGNTIATGDIIDDFASLNATEAWAEGEWSDYRGWPRALTFAQERAVYGGSTLSPQKIWLSKVGDYYDFTEGTDDDDAFVLEIASDKRQEIRWLGFKNNGVAIGTTGGIWRLAGSVNNPIMTPTNYDLAQQSAHESALIQAVPAGDALLFVDRSLRHIYELTWNDPRWEYESVPITTLCEHLTKGGITDCAFQKNPEPILWFTTNTSPYLFSLTYNRAQDVLAGARHPLGGDGIVESVCRIPSSGEDEIWLCVQRTINGSDVRYIERMKPWNFGDQEDAFFVDCGLKYDSTAASTFTSLDYVEGEEVAILGDGVVHLAQTVSGGTVSSESDVSVAIIGYAFTYTLKPMRFDMNLATRGLVKRVSRIVVSFYESLGVQYGRDNDHLYKVFYNILANKYGLDDATIFDSLRNVLVEHYGATAGATQFDIDWPRTDVFEAIPLYTGDMELAFDGAFESDDDLIITGSDPLPCTVRAITVTMDALGPQ